MSSKFALILTSISLAAIFLLSAPATSAQEVQAVVVDEVIAQVNDSIITLSMLKREMKSAAEALVAQNKVTPEQAAAEVEKRRAELILNLINEKLLLDKGKELDLAQDVEAEINSRMLAVAKEQGITKLDELYDAMRKTGLDPDQIRENMRAEMMKQAVFNRDVDSKFYFSIPDGTLQEYFKAHKDKFKKPEMVSISEIYLELAGKSEAEVKTRAATIVAQARKGADFTALATTYSERKRDGQRVDPKVGAFCLLFCGDGSDMPTLRDDLVAVLKSVKQGDVTDPIISAEGVQILHVDERVAAEQVPVFNESRVREAITIEQSPKAHKAYLDGLKKEAFIKVSDSYRELVQPLLGDALAPATVSNAARKGEKDKGKKP